MNPWDIVAWIGAICVSITLIGITALLVVAFVRSIRNKNTTRKVL